MVAFFVVTVRGVVTANAIVTSVRLSPGTFFIAVKFSAKQIKFSEVQKKPATTNRAG